MPANSRDEARCTRLEFFETPVALSLNALNDDFVVLHGGGIVNPFGPTLTMRVAVGTKDVGTTMAVIDVTLNPFSQSVKQVGAIKIRELINPLELLRESVPHSYGGCPTALLLSPFLLDTPRDAAHVVGLYLASRSHSRNTLALVRLHPGDPTARIAHELSRAMEMLAHRRGEAGLPSESGCLSVDEGSELATIQLQSEHWEREWHAFVDCWEQAGDPIQNTGLAALGLPFKEIQPIWAKAVDPSQQILMQLFPDDAA